MKILRCDKCGHEVAEDRGIVGHEFDVHGFQTLSPVFRFENVVDVCQSCFKEVQKAADEARKDRATIERKSFLQRIGCR